MQKVFHQRRYFSGNEVEFLTGGEPYFSSLLELINGAKQQLHFQVYIYDEDDTGKEVAAALKKARERGVEIFLAADSYGSKELSPEFVADLKAAGIHFRFFSPLPKHFWAFRLGRRMHNKVVVADQAAALIGGINIADKYRGSETVEPWLDFAILIKGPVCPGIARICERIYREKYFEKLHFRRIRTKVEEIASSGVFGRLSLNDWFRGKRHIGAGYRSAIHNAKHSITIVASYFLPSRRFRSALKKAARRGVKINFLLPGVSDVPMAKRATRYFYREMLRNNITIYEWNKSVLHGKMAVVDDKWVTVGSYNLNHLSHYSSIEMNVEVLDQDFAASTNELLAGLFEESTLVEANFGPKQRRIDKFFDWASYTIGRWTMMFLFFLVRRDHQYKEKE